ncbi:hypothetical protein B1R32_12818 [Abditibacterium utsteinense]|uniref:Lipoprotein n=1 Tax=Abditibacterium utsteinense TaxID=1960156 RepID=A0A2S8SP60_9BACT|nr:hypothetical protein B1R32_12818 [Abditibacterium utsteinense]
MKNWTQRFAVFAVFGTMFSSAMLVGCSKGNDAVPVSIGNNTSTDSSGKPIGSSGGAAPSAGASSGGSTNTDSAGNVRKN